jgi:coenzyme F420-reducing hydrogenase alpha subunit
MENITIGQIAVAIAFIAALITGGVKIKDSVKKWLTNTLKESFDAQTKQIEEVKRTVDNIQTQLKTVDMENTKNFLTTEIASLKRGEVKSEIEMQRFKEEYDHYINALKGNTYIKEEYEKLKAKGWI